MRRLVLAALAAAAVAIAATPAEAAKRAKVQAALDRLVDGGAPGAIMVVRSGDKTMRLASGVADRATRRKMRPRMHVRIASVTKPYTAAVVLQLAGEKKLRLGDSVERWLPGLVPNGKRMSIRGLLQHTTGLGDFEFDPRVLKPYLDGDLDFAWPPRRLAEIGAEQPVFFPPGKGFQYSNTNYILLGLIVEKVTGHSLGHEFRQRIFKPLGLGETSFPRSSAMPRPFAHGYRVLGQPPAVDLTRLFPYPWAAGGIVSTDEDVAKFLRALMSGRQLKPRLQKAMHDAILEDDGVDFKGQAYGLGVIKFPTRCGVAWGHNGDMPGYVSYAFSSRNGRRQMVLTVNEDALSLPRPAAKALRAAVVKGYCAT
jgi:D-alanyl-D-alanine carboxypeptidase